jgi:hypothetical protein
MLNQAKKNYTLHDDSTARWDVCQVLESMIKEPILSCLVHLFIRFAGIDLLAAVQQHFSPCFGQSLSRSFPPSSTVVR